MAGGAGVARDAMTSPPRRSDDGETPRWDAVMRDHVRRWIRFATLSLSLLGSQVVWSLELAYVPAALTCAAMAHRICYRSACPKRRRGMCGWQALLAV